MFINGGQLSTGREVCLRVIWCQEEGGPSGWLGSGRRGSFSSDSYCPHSPNASCQPGILHTSKLSLLKRQKNKRGRQTRLLSAAMLPAFRTKPLNLKCLLNPVYPFHCKFPEAQVSAGFRKGRSRTPLPIWYPSRDCVGRGRPIHCPAWRSTSEPLLSRYDLAGQMDRVGLGMCCPDKAAPEGVC